MKILTKQVAGEFQIEVFSVRAIFHVCFRWKTDIKKTSTAVDEVFKMDFSKFSYKFESFLMTLNANDKFSGSL